MSWKNPQIQGRTRIVTLARAGSLLASLTLWLAVSAAACSVPVFRYALERWPADHYEALVYSRGRLPDAAAQLIASAEKSTSANLAFRVIDLNTESDSELIELWEDEKTDTLPWLVLTYPKAFPYLGPVTSGGVTPEVLAGLASSPLRERVADRLTSGDTAVWILLESGDEQADAAAAGFLENRLKHLESDLKLPTLEQEDIDAGLVSVTQDELKIDFSMLRLSRDDPAEKVLIEMLLDSEEDLSDHTAPIVFPVFGRGRVLYGLVGEGINAGTVDQAAEYITGACSCQVKEQNPGVDLLMAKNWDDAIGVSRIADRELPPLEGAGLLLNDQADLSPDAQAIAGAERPAGQNTSDSAEPSATPTPFSKTVIWLVAILAIVVGTGTVLVLKRNPHSR